MLTYPESLVEMKFKTRYEKTNSELFTAACCVQTLGRGWGLGPGSDAGFETLSVIPAEFIKPPGLTVFILKGRGMYMYLLREL